MLEYLCKMSRDKNKLTQVDKENEFIMTDDDKLYIFNSIFFYLFDLNPSVVRMSKLLAFVVCCVAVKLSHAVTDDDLYYTNVSTTATETHRQPGATPSFTGFAHDEFDFSLMKKVLTENDKNAIVSPFFVKVLLSVLVEASGPETINHREIASAIASFAIIHDIHERYSQAYASISASTSNYDLKSDRRVFIDRTFTPQQRFTSSVQFTYLTKIEQIDFERVEEASNIINRWRTNATKNEINHIITSVYLKMYKGAENDPQPVMFTIFNIFFNGLWSKPFPENGTTVGDFFVNSKDSVPVQFMHKTESYYYAYVSEIDAQILRLPYSEDKFSMIIILPNRRDGIDELIPRIDSALFNRYKFLMKEVDVDVSIPKFNILNTVHLDEILKSLGIKSIFTRQASFPRLIRGAHVQDRLQMSDFEQSSGIVVSEKGSTVHSDIIKTLTRDNIEFNADHPFIFTIEDEITGTLLFTGKFIKPE